ncbi:MAG: hypothetical protein ICV76_02260 [Nitrospiraceae bacterium]|nr:hypothetical protein [Nitrospiraceae bacterium]
MNHFQRQSSRSCQIFAGELEELQRYTALAEATWRCMVYYLLAVRASQEVLMDTMEGITPEH